MNRVPMSREGYENLKGEIDKLEAERPRILTSIRERPLTAEIPIVLLESKDDKYTLQCGNHTSVISTPMTDAKLSRALERVGLTIA